MKKVLKTNGENRGNQPEMVKLDIQSPVRAVKPELRDILQESSESNEGSEHYKTYHQKSDFKQIISEMMGRLQNVSDRESLKAVNKTFYKVSLFSWEPAL